jgi:hypothetical protein
VPGLDIAEIRFGLIEPESLTIAGILYFTELLDSGMVQTSELSEKTLPAATKQIARQATCSYNYKNPRPWDVWPKSYDIPIIRPLSLIVAFTNRVDGRKTNSDAGIFQNKNRLQSSLLGCCITVWLTIQERG